MQFANFVNSLTQLEIHPFDELEFKKAIPLIQKFADQKLTLADAHGLLILGARRIKTCWSTDRHLGLTGATLVV